MGRPYPFKTEPYAHQRKALSRALKLKRCALLMEPRTSWQQRLWEKLSTPEEGCWEWQGAVTSSGYGIIGIGGRKGKLHRVHRAMYLLAYQEDPGKYEVCHTCDNRLCARPDHLFLGTRQDNTDDMISKERQARGEKNGRSRFTEKDVRHMRQLREEGMPYTKIGDLYGCDRATARKVCLLRWQHL